MPTKPKTGRPADKDRVKVWMGRVMSANKAFGQWEEKFECDTLESLYDGTGHWEESEDPNRTKYKLNRVFSAIEARIPTLLFWRPKTMITPRPARADDPGSLIDERSQLLEDTADTFIADDRVNFMDAHQDAIMDAHFYFGWVEIGYTTDWIDNPNAGKPALNDEPDEQGGDEQGPVQPDRLIEQGTERMFIKHIPADCCRVPLNSNRKLASNDFAAYYEWQRLEDVRSNPNYKNTSTLKATGVVKRDYNTGPLNEEQAKDGMVKLWKLWDQRAKVKRVMAEGHDRFLLEESYKTFPINDLRFHKGRKEYYPIPPVYNWKMPQREYNEVREDMRLFRRSSFPRYTYTDGSIELSELAKLENGGQFTVAKSNRPDPLQEVPRSEGRMMALRNSVPDAKDDFNEASATPGEYKGVSDATTATQANIIDVNARIRETNDREKVGHFLAKSIKIMLLLAREKMALKFLIKIHTDPMSPSQPQEAQRVVNIWKAINHEDLGDFDFDVGIDVEALSPATQDLKRNQFTQVLQLLQQPMLVAVLSNVDPLLKQLLADFGMRGSQQAMMVKQGFQAALQVMQQMQPPGQGGGGPPTGGGAQAPPPQAVLAQLLGGMGQPQ